MFFAFALWMLMGPGLQPKDWTSHTVISVVVHGVIPAFAAFSFYRLWLGVIEFSHLRFYLAKSDDLPDEPHFRNSPFPEPTAEDLNITPRASCGNLLVGFGYLVIPALFLIRGP